MSIEHVHRTPLLALLLLGAFAVTACAPTGSAASSTTTSTNTSSTASRPPCPNPHGGSCLGSLPAGTYETVLFAPKITYTVPEGWFNGEDLAGNFLLHRESDDQGEFGGSYVGIYQGARASAIDCRESNQRDVGVDSTALIDYIASWDGLIASEPEAVTVGGLSGLSIDLRDDPSTGEPCTVSDVPGLTFVPIIIGSGVSQMWHTVDEGVAVRLIVLDWMDENVTIEITSVEGQTTPDEYREIVQPIVDSLQFG